MKENIIQTKTFEFSLSIICLYKLLVSHNEYIISNQILKSATSIGANVQEAIAAYSKRDFLHKIIISHKEARETHYWILLLNRSKLFDNDYTDYLNKIDEILRILVRIIKTTKKDLS
jgi:four helix bundle protein